MDEVYEGRKSQSKEHELEGTCNKHREKFGLKNSNGSSFGRQGVDERMVLTN
jgi:hypothetical protein